jgi:hypothetical protein
VRARIGVFAGHDQRHGEVLARLDDARIDGERPLERACRALELALAAIRFTEVREVLRVRSDGGGSLEIARRLLPALALEQEDAEREERPLVLGVARNDLAVERLRVLAPPAAMQRERALVQILRALPGFHEPASVASRARRVDSTESYRSGGPYKVSRKLA